MLFSIAIFGCSFALYHLLQIVYRLFFHPLAKFPGPKLAAASYWYEFYYDVVQPGQYIWKIKELHQIYGPIVRINPKEVHINDPDFYGEIYHSKGNRTDRDPFYMGAFVEEAVAFTSDHDLHTLRRGSIVNYFSTRSILSLEDRITNVLSKLDLQFRRALQLGIPLNITHLSSAAAMDIASEVFLGPDNSTAEFAKSEPGKDFIIMVRGSLPIPNNFGRHFPWLIKTMQSLPESLIMKMNPTMIDFFLFKKKVYELVTRTIAENPPKVTGEGEIKEGRTIVHDMVASSLPPWEKTPSRLHDEAFQLISAAGVTTADVMSRTVFYILNTPSVLSRLQEELTTAMPDAGEIPTIVQMQQLPYLNAVIEEGLRMAFPVTARLPRVFREQEVRYGEWVIPAGSSISQSTYFVLSNPSVFPDPMTFNPQRWLENKDLLKYQVAFSKGRRSCLGQNLAYAELRLFLATLFRRFDMELFETSMHNARVVEDYFIGCAAVDSKGIRVGVAGLRK